jgi:4-aminobutyrate aminotransferase-like enzyme
MAVRAGTAIADEVQTGCVSATSGRSAAGVVPDVVTVAKAAGNGMAVGAVITHDRRAFRAEGSFFSSVGGPRSPAPGLAVSDDRPRGLRRTRVRQRPPAHRLRR